MQTWKTISRETVLNQGHFLQVESHVVQLPDGRLIPEWQWIITPDFVIVVAITSKQDYLLFRQTKYGVAGTSLAPVGGYIEPEEEPLSAAKRELLEETGHSASEWLSLGQYVVDANRGNGTAFLFLATNARAVAPITADDLEEQELLLLSRAEVEKALQAGEFKALPWVTAVALALRHET